MPRWMGLIGSWALLVLAVGLLSFAVAAESINLADQRQYRTWEDIDRMIADWHQRRVEQIQNEVDRAASSVQALEGRVESTEQTIQDLHDTRQIVVVSTTENRVYLQRGGEVVFDAVCSTGKGTTLRHGGRTMVFRTPIGKFRILSKETDPKWVPPDWHYIEQANKTGRRVIRLDWGQTIGTPERLFKVVGKDVVEINHGYSSVLPQGSEIYVGDAILIPPVGTRQREYPDVLGTHRLNLGDGYALHGTQAVSQLGQSVSHGCIRLSNQDIARLYEMANVGDEVIIY